MLLFYLRSAGLLISALVLVLATLMEACTVAGGVWLARWSSANVTSSSERDRYLGVYGAIGLAEALFVLLTCLTVALGAVNASLTLHRGLLTNIMHAPMLFFETTPLGRIVNRFSQDMYVIDETIRRAVSDVLMTAFPLLGVLVVVSYVTPLFLSVVLPLGLLYAFIQVRVCAEPHFRCIRHRCGSSAAVFNRCVSRFLVVVSVAVVFSTVVVVEPGKLLCHRCCFPQFASSRQNTAT